MKRLWKSNKRSRKRKKRKKRKKKRKKGSAPTPNTLPRLTLSTTHGLGLLDCLARLRWSTGDAPGTAQALAAVVAATVATVVVAHEVLLAHAEAVAVAAEFFSNPSRK
jgi:hypothetical protein